MEDDPARGGGVEHAVDDHAMEVQVRIERGAEAVDEGHRAEAGRGARTRAVRAQAWLHRAQEQAQSSTLKFGIAVQEVAQALGHRQDPLPHRQAWQDVIGEMGRRRHHAPGVARWADASALARERDQEVVPALPAAGAGEAVGQDAALQVAAELALDVGGYRFITRAGQREPGREVGLHGAVQQRALGPAPPVRRSALARPETPRPSAMRAPAARRSARAAQRDGSRACPAIGRKG